MVLWIGVDDTDSLQGMCTTFLATELVRELTREYDLIGYPRLVRLNPNIPWKTRGNGAICLRIGEGRGPSRVVGRIGDREIRSFPRSRSDPRPAEVRDRVAKVVETWSRFEDDTTNPAFAILERPPSAGLYWKAVRHVVSLSEALRSAEGRGLVVRYKNGRGAIGALAAAAWRPRDRTYEVLAYRSESRWGTPRAIDSESVREMDRSFPSTFNNYDFANDCVVIAPRSPCPVLFGIRGDDVSLLPQAMSALRGEALDRWLLFETNQGTDDHVIPKARPNVNETVRVTGRVTSPGRTLAGGHVVFRMGRVDVVAYEPSKQFRRVVRRLAVNDRVRAIGAVREVPRSLNLEKLEVLDLAVVTRKVANPFCQACGKHAKSRGKGAGFRCARCGVRFPSEAATTIPVPRGLTTVWYEPPVGSRRHLSKPIKRMARDGSHAGGRAGRLDAESRDSISHFDRLDYLR